MAIYFRIKTKSIFSKTVFVQKSLDLFLYVLRIFSFDFLKLTTRFNLLPEISLDIKIVAFLAFICIQKKNTLHRRDKINTYLSLRSEFKM
jgi:hypothetical protein